MKKILLIVIFISIHIFPQNILLLKSGEKFQGKMVEFKNGKIQFSVRNNLLTFNANEVVSIIFNSDTLVNYSDQKLNATIKGVVTYFFNENFGYKPDVGADIFIINDKDLGNINTDYIQNYKRAKTLFDLIILGSGKMNDNFLKELSEINAETKDKFKDLDDRSGKAILAFRTSGKAIELSVDGNGGFSKVLKPGDYSLLIVSKNRKDLTLSEVMGKIYFQKLKLLNDTEEDIKVEFDQSRHIYFK